MRVYVRACLHIFLCLHFDSIFSHFNEKTRIQTTENSEIDNSEIKQEIRKKTEVNKDKLKL